MSLFTRCCLFAHGIMWGYLVVTQVRIWILRRKHRLWCRECAVKIRIGLKSNAFIIDHMMKSKVPYIMWAPLEHNSRQGALLLVRMNQATEEEKLEAQLDCDYFPDAEVDAT